MGTKNRLLIVIVLAVLALSATGCAIPVAGGKLYLFGVTEYAMVTNNFGYPGDLHRNSVLYKTLQVGDSCAVPLEGGTNMVLTFKAFQYSTTGERLYVGVAEQTFQPTGQLGYLQTWVITYVQKPYR